MKRRRSFFGPVGGLGDLERYGLLALIAALLLAIAFIAQLVAGEVAPFRSMSFRSDGDPPTALAVSRDVDLPRVPESATDAPGGGETNAPVAAATTTTTALAPLRRRPDFDFYEAPIRLPGKPSVLPPPPPGRANEGDARVVRVRRGETLQKIALRELGAASRWRTLLDWNPGVDPKKLQPGTDLRIPARSREPSAAPAAPTVRLHEVAPDDTLQSIAEKYYGDRARWIDLLEANRDRMSAPANLRAGMKIKVP